MILHIKRCENMKLSTIKAITMSLVSFFYEQPKFATAYEIM